MLSPSTPRGATADTQPNVTPERAAQETEALQRLRWRVCQAALVIASLALAAQLPLAFLGVEGPTYSPFALIASSLWFALWAVVQGRVGRVSPLAERAGYLGALAIFLDFYTRTLLGIDAGTRPLSELNEILPWFATVYTAAFIIYSGRTALVLCGSVILYTSGLSVFLAVRASLDARAVLGLEAAFDLLFSSVILLLLLFVLKRTTEAWARAQAQAQALAQLANRDALTGLYNRRYLGTALQEEVKRARRYAHPLSIAICDIDHFKEVNDRFSHGVGDQVLQQTARLLESNVRGVDVVARYGGEEFVLLFPETGLASARTACEKIRQTVEHYPWLSLHPDLHVTLSIGVADAVSAHSDDLDTLLSAADYRLYEAKNAGRNRVHPALDD